MPQYVVDWIKYCKFTNVNLGRALFISDIDFYNYESQEDCSKLKEFLGTETNQETFALAWTLGYDVEECLTIAYNDIKDRQGVMIDDNFIKTKTRQPANDSHDSASGITSN